MRNSMSAFTLRYIFLFLIEHFSDSIRLKYEFIECRDVGEPERSNDSRTQQRFILIGKQCRYYQCNNNNDDDNDDNNNDQ